MLSLSQCREFTQGKWLQEPLNESVSVAIETDSRKDCSSGMFVAFSGERFDAHDFLDSVIAAGVMALCVHRQPSAELLLRAKEKGVGVLLVDDTVKAYQDLASGKLQNSSCKVIAITGSSGKTSVKSILSQMLEEVAPGQVLSTVANTNNHIGVPQNVLRLEEEHKYAVIEQGTNNPGEIATLAKCAPGDISLITSIGDSHSGNFPQEQGILYEKSDIIKYMKSTGLAVIPVDLVEAIESTGALKGKIFKTFGRATADFNVDYIEGRLSGAEIEILGQRYSCSLSGAHQAQNIAACCLVMQELGYSLSDYSDVLSRLELPGMRMKLTEEKGVMWVNDAYNANPQSMKAFISWLKDLPELSEKYKNRYLVLGDMLELGDHSLSFHQQIVSELPKDWVVVGVGKDFSAVESAQLVKFSKSEEAADFINNKLGHGDFVALKGSRGIRLEEIFNKFKTKEYD